MAPMNEVGGPLATTPCVYMTALTEIYTQCTGLQKSDSFEVFTDLLLVLFTV